MVCTLVWREFFSSKMDLPLLDAVASEIQERKEWMGIYVQGQKVGFASSQISKEGEGLLIEEQAILRMRLLGIPREVKTTMELRTNQEFLMQSFRLRLSTGPTQYEMAGRLHGQVLKLDVQTAGRHRTHEIPMEQVPWMPQNLRYLLFRTPLDVGRKYQLALFDPMTSSAQPLQIHVEGRETWTMDGKEVPIYRLVYTWGSLQSRAWVSEAGETLREEGWGGFTLVRESPEEALTEGWPADGRIDLMLATAIPVKKKIPSPRELIYMSVRFSKVDLKSFAYDDLRQKTRGPVVVVHKEDLSRASTYPLPRARSPELEDTLEPTPLIQSDDPQILALAQEILGTERDALKASKMLSSWVYEHVEKIPTVSVPSAVEVLETKKGDCNEHAVLFAALARAAGIPTKVSAGIVYQDGSFYYHAWNEVYLGRWFSLDSLLNQFPVDATHVKFVEGDLDRQAQLVPLIGNIKAEILAYQ